MSGNSLRSCPVCDRFGRRLVHRVCFMDGPIGDGYDVVTCNHCGAGFADGIASQAALDRYYVEQSKYTYGRNGGAESFWDLMRFESTVKQVMPYLQSFDAKILDVGCATGGLLSVFRRCGFGNLLGADPSSVCASEARRLYDVDVRAATFSQMSSWNERFDLIMMVGVLEHLREAKNAIRTAIRLLNRGGLLYCAVPDVAFLAECQGAPYQQFSIEHVNFFSINSLSRLMLECGMCEICTWNWKVNWSADITEPIASGLYRIGISSKTLSFDKITGPSLERYTALSLAGDREINKVIESVRKDNEPMLIWGAGTLCRRLLACTRLAETNIAAFVDANRYLQGELLAGRRILSPWDARCREERILICSVSYANEIIEDIRRRYGMKNSIVTLLGEEFN